MVLAFAAPSTAHAAETDPPQIASMVLQPTAGVDVSAGPKTVRAVLQLTDPSGVKLVTATLESVDTTQVTPLRAGARVAGTAADGTWWINFSLPQGAAPGQWRLKIGAVDDNLGNRLNGATIPEASLPTINVTSVPDADVDGPELVSSELSPTTVDVGPSAQQVTATFHVTDQTGVAHVFGGLRAVGGGQVTPNVQATLVDGTPQDGTWQATYTIPKGALEGQWQVRLLLLDDVLTNSTNVLLIPLANLAKVTVNVSHVPDQPTDVRATAGNERATVSWTAPAANGTPITSYEVTTNPGGTVTTVAGDKTSAVVEGLTNGTPYTFTVVAINAVGPSTASAPTSAVTPNNVFTTGPTATITGHAQAGETLTAHEGTPSPEPDAYAYQWFAAGVPIVDADGKTFELTSAQVGKTVTVMVTAIKDGYVSASDVSDPTAVIATPLDVASAKAIVQNGRYTRVTAAGLGKREAYTVTLNGVVAKTGKASYAGTAGASFKVPTTLAEGPVDVVVTAASGSTGRTTFYNAKPRTFSVVPGDTSVARNGTTTVLVTGMAPGEKVRVTFSGRAVSPRGAVADADGTYSQSFTVGTRLGARPLKVFGLYTARNGASAVTVTP